MTTDQKFNEIHASLITLFEGENGDFNGLPEKDLKDLLIEIGYHEEDEWEEDETAEDHIEGVIFWVEDQKPKKINKIYDIFKNKGYL